MLGAVERNALLLDPLYTEDSSQTQHIPVLAALLTDGRGHASVTLQKHPFQHLGMLILYRNVDIGVRYLEVT